MASVPVTMAVPMAMVMMVVMTFIPWHTLSIWSFEHQEALLPASFELE